MTQPMGRRMAAVMTLMMLTPLVPQVTARAAGVDTMAYTRSARNFDTTTAGRPISLGTRGYLQDCIATITECASASSYKRPEATAQVKAIAKLSQLQGSPVVSDAVQWEVGTTPDGQCAPEARNGTDTRVDVVAPPTNCPWRIDIMVDHGASAVDIYEVKRWRGPQTRIDVNTQLTRYVTALSGVGLTPTRGTQLNNWLMSYQAYGKDWCVWGDRDSSTAALGNVYFAETPSADPTVRSSCQSTGIVQPAIQAHPFLSCLAQWSVNAPRDGTKDTSLRFEYGDGASVLCGAGCPAESFRVAVTVDAVIPLAGTVVGVATSAAGARRPLRPCITAPVTARPSLYRRATPITTPRSR